MKKILNTVIFLIIFTFAQNTYSNAHVFEYDSIYYGGKYYIPNIKILNNPKNITLKNIDSFGNSIWEITYDNQGRPVLQKIYIINRSYFSDIEKNIDLSKNVKTTYAGYYKYEYPDEYTIKEEFFPVADYLKSYVKYKAVYKLDKNKQITEKYFPLDNKTEKFNNKTDDDNWKYFYDKNGLLIKKEKPELGNYNDEYYYYYDDNKKLTKMYYKDNISSNGDYNEYVYLYDKYGNIISLYTKPHKSKNIKTETMAYDKYGHRIKYNIKYKTNKVLFAATKPFFSLLEYVIQELAN